MSDRSPASLKAPAIMLVLAGAVLLLISTALTWISANGLGDTSAVAAYDVTGAEAASAARAMGLVGAAGAIAVALARRLMRMVIGVVLLAAGVTAVGTAISALLDPAAAASGALAQVTGTTAEAAQYSLGPGLWVGLLGATAMIAGALLVLIRGRNWSDRRGSRKYERSADTEVSAPDEFDLWDGLSDGADLTDQDPTSETDRSG